MVMEHMNGFEDITDFESLMKAQYDFDLTKYLSGDEFDLVAYDGVLGFEVPYGLQHSKERQVYYCELLFEIDGRTYNAYFDRVVGDEPYAGVNIIEYPWKTDENICVSGMGFAPSDVRNIRITGVEGEGAEGLWLNGYAFYQLAWYLDKVADANSLSELSEIDFNLW